MYQRLIPTGDLSGLLTHIATMESGSLSARMKQAANWLDWLRDFFKTQRRRKWLNDGGARARGRPKS